MYEYDSRVRLTEVDENQKMTLMGILNAFQDCSIAVSADGLQDNVYIYAF